MAPALNPLERALQRVSDAEPTEIVEGISVPVATRAHLIALKVLARDDRNRPQDWDDLRALLLDASSQEVHEAREALELIEQRGYNRGRSLSADLDRALVDTKTLAYSFGAQGLRGSISSRSPNAA